MPYCSRCGVEVNEMIEKCPLCQSPIQKLYEDPHPGREFPEDQLNSASPSLSPKEKKMVAFSMTSFGILIPLLITLSVDVVLTGGVSWSVYPLIGLSGSWLLSIIPITLPRKSSLIIWTEAAILCTVMGFLYHFTTLSSRVITLGLPITFTGAVISHIIVYISERTARKGGNIAGFILIGLGVLCAFTDLFITKSLKGTVSLGWSLIVMAALFPVSGMLLYLHYRKKRSRLKKFFHI